MDKYIIELGKNPYSGDDMVQISMSWGVEATYGFSRSGKTCFVKNKVLQEAEHRPLLIFDPYNEWGGIAQYNPLALTRTGLSSFNTYPAKLDDVRNEDEVEFAVSDFNKPEHWRSLKFPPGAAEIMTDVAVAGMKLNPKTKKYEGKPFHGNDMAKITEILNSIPTSNYADDIRGFEHNYGEYIHISRYGKNLSSVKSILEKWPRVKQFFSEERSVPHWGQHLLDCKRLVVNFDATPTEIMRLKVRAFAGIVLEELTDYHEKYHKSYLGIIKPLIVVDEADIFAPKQTELFDVFALSSDILEAMTFKLGREGVKLMYITQDPSRLNHSIQEGVKAVFVGKMGKGNPYQEITNKLKWNPENNYREMCYLKEGGGRFYFTPKFTPCA